MSRKKKGKGHKQGCKCPFCKHGKKAVKNPFKRNRFEIRWNLINSAIAGGLVFLGAAADGSVTWKGLLIAAVACLAVALAKFRDYWLTQKREYTSKMFSFVGRV